MMAVSSVGGRPARNIGALADEIGLLAKTTAAQQTNIHNSQLRSINSSLTVIMADAQRDITPLRGGTQAKKSAVPSQTAALAAALNTRLEEARLNAVFDRTYAREIGYQLERLTGLAAAVGQDTRSQTVKDFITRLKGNISPLQKQLATFTAASS